MPDEKNRVLVDLPLRLQKAKAAAFALEQERNELLKQHSEARAEANRYREALEKIHQSGRGKHVKIAREALTSDE